MMNKKKIGRVLVRLGALLLIAALALYFYNLYDDSKTNAQTMAVINELNASISK